MPQKKSMPYETEGHIQNAVCEYLEVKNYCFWRSNNVPMFSRNEDGSIRFRSMPKYTPKGLPDITIIKDGIYHGLEIKRQTGTQSEEQREIEHWIKQNGGKYDVVRSLDDLQAIGL